MREIKFRAWSKNRQQMMYKILVGNTETCDPCSAVLDENGEWAEFDKFCGEIMQYTGLKDKKGKEIYEGDILKVITPHQNYNAIVKYDDIQPSFVLVSVKDILDKEYDFLKCDLMVLEIIGNIYENPELLENNNG